MSFSESGGIITQTGTDTDLSGLNGVTGVTRTIYNYQTLYELDDKTLRIEGTCTQSITDRLIIDGPNPGGVDKQSMIIPSGGTYTFGEELTFTPLSGADRTVVAGGHFLFLAKPTGPSSWKNEQCGLLVESGGTFNVYGGSIRANQAINFEAGSTCFMRDALWIHTSDAGFINFYLRDADVDIIGFKYLWGEDAISGGAVAFLANYTQMEGFFPIGIAIPIGPIDSLPHGLVIIEKYLGGGNNPVDINFRNNADDNDEYRMMEANVGNNLLVRGRGVNDSRGWATHYIRWTPTCINSVTKAALEDVTIYMIDTDNSDRLSPYSPGDQIIDEATLADGQFSATTKDVLTAVWHNDSNQNIVQYVLDDRLPISGGAMHLEYLIVPLTLTDSEVGEDSASIQMVFDVTLIETNHATILAYSSLDDNQELYDRAKKEQLDAYAGESAQEVAAIGAYLEPQGGLVIDPAASSVYDFGSLVTIESAGFTGAIINSGGDTVLQKGTQGAIDYEVNGVLEIEDASVPWTVSKDVVDIQNIDSGNNLVVLVVNGATVTTTDVEGTGNGEVDIQTAVTLTVTVTDADTGSPIEFAHVILLLTSDYSTQVLNAATNASGVATTAYNYAGDVTIEGWARNVDFVAADYEPQPINGTITAAGFVAAVALTPNS